MIIEYPQIHRFNLEEWRKLGEADIFVQENHLQLIEGEILDFGPITPNHAGHCMRLTSCFGRLDEHIIVSVNGPVSLEDHSQPQPDLSLLKHQADFSSTRHPNAADVLLLVEVSDSTLRFDKTQKLRLYATHGISEYWIVNLIDDCLEVHRQPQDDDYLDKSILSKADSLNLQTLPNIQVAVSSIL